MNLTSFLKVLGVALAGTTINTLAPMAAAIPSKYTPAVTAGLMGVAYAMQSPRQDTSQQALLQQVFQTQALIQQQLLSLLPNVPAAAAIASPAPESPVEVQAAK
jgi:hypothetical protein